MVELPALDLQVRRRQLALAHLRELLNALFLHGLAGRGAEWDALRPRVPAAAPDLRDHGTRAEFVAEVVGLIAGEPVMLIGQSLGGHTAMLVAARHPSLVERLVVIEASPARAEGVSERVRAFFQANPEAYDAHLDVDGAAATVAELDQSDWWDDWRAIRCPVLVVRGEDGNLDAATAAQMAATNPNAEVVVIERAGHDVHLDRPDGLAGVIERFAQD